VVVRTTSGREPCEYGSAQAGERAWGPFAVETVAAGRTAVLSLSGRVDLTALPGCRRAIDTLLREGVVEITVDLQVARFDDESIALLALMRRYALRHGARLVLADIPPHVARVLRRTGVSWLYRNDTTGSPHPPSATSVGGVPLGGVAVGSVAVGGVGPDAEGAAAPPV